MSSHLAVVENTAPAFRPNVTAMRLPKEAWKFTNLARSVTTLECTPLCTTIGCLEAALPVVSGPQMVFHNGDLSDKLSGSASLAVGVTLETGPQQLNPTAMLDELDELPSTCSNHHTLTVRGKVKLPLHLIHAASGNPSTSRFTIRVEKNAELTLIEHQVAAPHFTTWQNISMAIHVASGAILTHSVQQTLPPTCLLTRRTFVTLEDNATYHGTTFQHGAQLSRIETHATLATATSFNHTGLSLARRSQHHSNLLHVRHQGEANQTNIRQRNLIDDTAHSAFQGKFHVEQAAQKTNAYMHCHNLLLANGARTSHKPELEIYADDVKCSHGAATGGLNPHQLFYLKARGFTAAAARALLTVGFAQEFIQSFPEILHQPMEHSLQNWLSGHVDTQDPTPDFGMDPIRRDEGTTYARLAETDEALMNNLAAHFPALTHKPYGQRLAFLDSAASAQKPQVVLDALTQTLSGPYANIHRGLYYNSAETTAAFEAARTRIATFLNADAGGLVFTRNATEGINLVAQTWGRQNLKANSVITLTEAEHHANIVPWQLLQAGIGFQIRVIPLALLQSPTTQALTPYLEGSSLLALTQMSNVTGLQPNLGILLPAARSHGAKILLDGSQATVHAPQNLTALDADFYVATAHKLYGPNGIGLLWGKPALLATLPPYQGGGDMIEQVTLPLGTTYAAPPARFEAGTPAIAEAIAFAAAANFMETTVGWESIQSHEAILARQLTETLASLPFIQSYSPPNTGIAAFNIKGAHPADVATLLDQQGVAVRSGHHCAMPYMQALGIAGCCRASLALYSTEEDLTQFAMALHKAHKLLS